MSFIGWVQDVGKAILGMGGQELSEQQLELARDAYERGLTAWEAAQYLAPTAEEITPDYVSMLDIAEGRDPRAQQWYDDQYASRVEPLQQYSRSLDYRLDAPDSVRNVLEFAGMGAQESIPSELRDAVEHLRELGMADDIPPLEELSPEVLQTVVQRAIDRQEFELANERRQRQDQARQRGEQFIDRATASQDEILQGVAGAYTDPRSIEGQQHAADAYRDIYEAGGLDARTRAENEAMRRREQMEARAQREAILQNYASRGLGGAGAEMQAQLASQQGLANREYLAALGNLAEGQQRAQDALKQSADISGEMRSQSFKEESRRRGARDFWRGANQDFYQNLYADEAQARNRQAEAQAQAPQTVFGNATTIAGGLSGSAQAQGQAAQRQGEYYGNQAQQNAQNAVNTAASLVGRR